MLALPFPSRIPPSPKRSSQAPPLTSLKKEHAHAPGCICTSGSISPVGSPGQDRQAGRKSLSLSLSRRSPFLFRPALCPLWWQGRTGQGRLVRDMGWVRLGWSLFFSLPNCGRRLRLVGLLVGFGWLKWVCCVRMGWDLGVGFWNDSTLLYGGRRGGEGEG